MASIELSRYAFESLRTDEDFHLYRGCEPPARSAAGGGDLSSFAKASTLAEATADVSEDKGPSSILVLARFLHQMVVCAEAEYVRG